MNKRFANPEFFGQIGRPPLVLLLGQFAPEFAAQEIELPDAELDEKRFFRELAELGASKKGLPPKLIDVLHGVMAMGNEEGKDRLIQAAARAGMRNLQRICAAVLPHCSQTFRKEGAGDADSDSKRVSRLRVKEPLP
jgi:hypothetical protein